MKVVDLRAWKSEVNIITRTNDGGMQWTNVPYEWYFYILVGDEERVRSVLPAGSFTKIVPGRQYAKVYGDYWEFRKSWLPTLQYHEIPTFEGDLDLADRYKYDHQIEIDDRVDLLYFDIETDDRLRRIEIGRDYIVSFAAIDLKGNRYFVRLEEMTPDAEWTFLTTVNNIIRKYQIIAGWNINNFDVPYLRMRMKNYDMRLAFTGRYDMFERAKHIYRFDSTIKSFSLENFSQTFLKRGKLKHDKGIFDLWNTNDPVLEEYNVEDCQLCADLDKVLNICGMMILQSQWCKVVPRKFSLYNLIDSVIIQKSHKLGRPVPTNYNALKAFDDPTLDEDVDKYMGAEVLDPIIGLHENLYVFDFKSLYPSMMMTFNIGYDTLMLDRPDGDDYIIAPGPSTIGRESKDGKIMPTYFKAEPSCIAETIKELITLRTSYKNLKLKYIEEGKTDSAEYQKVMSDEIIVKELSNSVYGIMGMSFGRYYNIHVAESITLSGRWVLHFAQAHFRDIRGYDVVYGDTDSIFVQTGQQLDLEGELKLFHEHLYEVLAVEYKVPEPYIQLNFDKHYTRFILFAKKNYAGHCDNMEGKVTDKLYVRGMEYIKRNTFQWAAKRQKQLLEDILRSKLGRKEVITRIREYKQEFFNTEFSTNDLKITQRVGQETYNNTALIGRLAKRYKDITGINPVGMELEFIITDNKKGLRGCLLQDYTGRFSRTHYWENFSRPLFDKILGVVDPGKNIDYATLWD